MGGIIYSFFRFERMKQPMSDALNAIPSSAALIVRLNQPQKTWNKFSGTSIIWEELSGTDFFSNLNKHIHFLDSIRSTNQQADEILQNQPIYLSAHQTGAETYHFLFAFSIPPDIDPDRFHKLVKNLSEGSAISKKEYESAMILNVNNPNNTFSYTLHQDIFIGSFSAMLVEEAVRQLNTGNSILNDQYFTKALSTSGKKNDVNMYINHRFLPYIISTYLKDPAESLSDFASWTELDMKQKPNTIRLNGFTYTNDSINNFLDVFSRQKPVEVEMGTIIPASAATLVHYGFSDFAHYYEDFKTNLDKNHRLAAYEKSIHAINDDYGCNLGESILSWIAGEMAVVITEPAATESSENTYAIFRSNDIELAKIKLEELSATTNTGEAQEIPLFREYEIGQVKIPGMIPKLFGNNFSGLQQNYYTIIGQYVVFGNSVKSLRNFISSYLAEKTLSKDLNYAAFSENLSSSSNLFIYSNIARSATIYKAFTKEEYAADIENNLELFRKFEAVACQISHEGNGMFYNHIFLKYNPVYMQESTSLWETRLDSSVSMKPTLVINHYTGYKEVAVQDDGNTIYLLSSAGKVLWKKHLGEIILSDVHQIDVYKNNKFQMLFNTGNKLYLLDRNGKDVEGFPVKLKSTATNALAVFDYDNEKDYRILIAGKDQNIYNYDKTGKLIKGWDCAKTKSPVKLPLQHFTLNTKDYIVAIDSSGNVMVLDRKGSERLQINEQLPVSDNNNFYIKKGKDINKTRLIATDSIGQVVKLFFSGEIDHTLLRNFSKKHFFAYQDINNDLTNELIFIDSNQLFVYDQEVELLFNYQSDSMLTQAPLFFNIKGEMNSIGVVSTLSNEAFLFSGEGVLYDEFPRYGYSPFCIADINKDGTFNLVIGGNDRKIYTYSLE